MNCANGETVTLTHDTHLPRPYSIGFRVQGIEGLWMDIANSMYVYDSMTINVIMPLSEKSIIVGNVPQEIPDFTKGKWKDHKNTFALNDSVY